MILSDLSERLGRPVLSISRRLGGRSRRGDRSRTIADHLGDPRPVHGSEVPPAPNGAARSSSVEGRDARDRTSVGQSSYQQVREQRREACYRLPRNPGRRSGSKLDTATRFPMLFGLFQYFIQAPGRRITLDLTVPLVRDELLKPSGEDGKLLRREIRHSGFDFLNTHCATLRLDDTEIKVNRVFQPHLVTFQRFPRTLGDPGEVVGFQTHGSGSYLVTFQRFTF